MILDFRSMRHQGNWFLNLLAPAAYWLITALFNVYPLPQLSGFRRSFRHAGAAIDRRYSVLVFPEGRRADTEAPQAFKSGAGLLWKELGTPALPVRLRGLGELKTISARWFRSGRITVWVGEPLPLDRSKTPDQLTDLLWHAVFDQ
jgi:long-chain acyl-CoA synthetase